MDLTLGMLGILTASDGFKEHMKTSRRLRQRHVQGAVAVETVSSEPPEELSPLIEALERARLRASAATALREALESEVQSI